MGWVVNATARSLYPRERPGTRCIGGWLGPRAGLDGRGKSRPPPLNRDFTPGTIRSVVSRYTDCRYPGSVYVEYLIKCELRN
jgi:hypothetical protein